MSCIVTWTVRFEDAEHDVLARVRAPRILVVTRLLELHVIGNGPYREILEEPDPFSVGQQAVLLYHPS